jgi:hypothetical protein
LTNLAYSSNFNVTVTATNAAGSTSTLPVSFSTTARPIAAPFAPTSLAMSSITTQSATVTWSAPASQGDNTTDRTVANYEVRRNGTLIATVPATTLTYDFTGLTYSTSYSVTITATNSAGGTETLPVNFTTSERTLAAPNAATNVAASNVTTGGATITWTAPANQGDNNTDRTVATYQVRVNGTLTATVNAPTTTATLTGLNYETLYNISVTAVNSAGSSTAATTSFTTLPNPLKAFSYPNSGTLTLTRGASQQTFAPQGITTSNPTYSIISGSLPAATSLNTSTGVISGPGDWGYIVGRAGNTGQDVTRAVIATNDGGYLHVGHFVTSIVFGSTTLTSAGGQDIFVAKANSEGRWIWAIRAGGTGNDSAESVTIGITNGEAIISGFFNGTATFPGLANLGANSGTQDGFVAKVTGVNGTSGAWSWRTRFGGSPAGTETGRAVTTLSDGTGYTVTGWYRSNNNAVWVNSNDTTAFTRAAADTANTDAFVAKINNAGTWQWVNRISNNAGTGIDNGTTIKADSSGRTIVGGLWGSGTTLNFYNNSNSITMTRTSGNTTIKSWIARVQSNGTWDWSATIDGVRDNGVYGVEVLSDNSTIVTGYNEDIATLRSWNGTTVQSNCTGLNKSSCFTGGSGETFDNDAFVARLNDAGNWQWVARAGGHARDRATNAILLGNGELLISGFSASTSTGPMTFPGGGTLSNNTTRDTWLATITTNGSWTSSRRYAANGFDEPGFHSLAPTANGGAVLVGFFVGTMAVSGVSGHTLTSAGAEDLFHFRVGGTGIASQLSPWSSTSNQTGSATIRVVDGAHEATYPVTIGTVQ